MALGPDKQYSSEWSAKATISSSSAVKGFDISTYRETNKVRLYLASGKSVSKVFEAYASGNLDVAVALNTGNLGISESLQNLTGPVFTTAVRAATGVNMAAIDQPIHPRIHGTEPLSFDVKCYLPINAPTEGKEGSNRYEKNILYPLNNLLMVVLPERNKTLDNLTQQIDSAVTNQLDSTLGTDNDFWGVINNVIQELKNDFVTGIYALDNPIQFAHKGNGRNSLILRIGRSRIPDVMISNVNFTISPSIYTDGSNIYPSRVDVSFKATTLYKATPSVLNIGKDYSKSLDKYKENSK